MLLPPGVSVYVAVTNPCCPLVSHFEIMPSLHCLENSKTRHPQNRNYMTNINAAKRRLNHAATGNIHRKFDEVGHVVPETWSRTDRRTDRQTDKQTHRHTCSLLYSAAPYIRGEVSIYYVHWKWADVASYTINSRSHSEMVGDMSRVTLNFDQSKILFVHF